MVRAPKPSIHERIAAIKNKNVIRVLREHPQLGRGTDSIIDQCFTDEEILEELSRERIETAPAAIRHFAIWEGLELEDVEGADTSDDAEPPWWREWDDHRGRSSWD